MVYSGKDKDNSKVLTIVYDYETQCDLLTYDDTPWSISQKLSPVIHAGCCHSVNDLFVISILKGVSKNGDISNYSIWSIKWPGLKRDIIGVLSHQ